MDENGGLNVPYCIIGLLVLALIGVTVKLGLTLEDLREAQALEAKYAEQATLYKAKVESMTTAVKDDLSRIDSNTACKLKDVASKLEADPDELKVLEEMANAFCRKPASD